MNSNRFLVAATIAALGLSGCATKAQIRYKQEQLEREQLVSQTLDNGGRCIMSSERFASKDMLLRMSHVKKYVDGMWVDIEFDGQFLTVMFDYSDMLKFDVVKKGAITRNNRYVFLETSNGDYGVYTLTNNTNLCAYSLGSEGMLLNSDEIGFLQEHNVL